MNAQEEYHQLAFYTSSKGDRTFIHQHAVDAFTAQMANAHTKPIALFYALAGLYLHLVKGFTGKQVQEAHLLFAKKTKTYPLFTLPANTGNITVTDVMKKQPGDERDSWIKMWCISVWEAYESAHPEVITLTEKLLLVH